MAKKKRKPTKRRKFEQNLIADFEKLPPNKRNRAYWRIRQILTNAGLLTMLAALLWFLLTTQ